MLFGLHKSPISPALATNTTRLSNPRRVSCPPAFRQAQVLAHRLATECGRRVPAVASRSGERPPLPTCFPPQPLPSCHSAMRHEVGCPSFEPASRHACQARCLDMPLPCGLLDVRGLAQAPWRGRAAVGEGWNGPGCLQRGLVVLRIKASPAHAGSLAAVACQWFS